MRYEGARCSLLWLPVEVDEFGDAEVTQQSREFVQRCCGLPSSRRCSLHVVSDMSCGNRMLLWRRTTGCGRWASMSRFDTELALVPPANFVQDKTHYGQEVRYDNNDPIVEQ